MKRPVIVLTYRTQNNRQCTIQRLGLRSQLRCSSIGFVHGDISHIFFPDLQSKSTQALVTGAGRAVLSEGIV